MAFASVSLTGCFGQKDQTPAETSGEIIEDAGDAMEDSADDAGDAIEDLDAE